ncbi:hypothetical protein AURDEDRAFT_128419 [Auricularia subglabra TFB-10046 SS5]|nr:hypothetical protein AURDEDRAFT_128419 [Auricularia subglabra TFB-10046 SS5]
MSNNSSSGHSSADEGSNPPEGFTFDPSLFDPMAALNHFVAGNPSDNFDSSYHPQHAYPVQNTPVPYYQPPGNDLDLLAGNAGWSAMSMYQAGWGAGVPNVDPRPPIPAPHFADQPPLPPLPSLGPSLSSSANVQPPFWVPPPSATHQPPHPLPQLAPLPQPPFAGDAQFASPLQHRQPAGPSVPPPMANTLWAQHAHAPALFGYAPPPSAHLELGHFDAGEWFQPNVDGAYAGIPPQANPSAVEPTPTARRTRGQAPGRPTRRRGGPAPAANAQEEALPAHMRGSYDSLGLWIPADETEGPWDPPPSDAPAQQTASAPTPPLPLVAPDGGQDAAPARRRGKKRARAEAEHDEPAQTRGRKKARSAAAEAGLSDTTLEGAPAQTSDSDPNRFKQFCVRLPAPGTVSETPGAGPSNLGLNVQDNNNDLAGSGTQAKGRKVTIWDGPESERPTAAHGGRYPLNKPRPTDRDWYCKSCYDDINAGTPGLKRRILYWLTVDGARKHVHHEHPEDGDPRHVRERGGGSGTKRKRQPLPPSDEQEDAGSEGEGGSNEG